MVADFALYTHIIPSCDANWEKALAEDKAKIYARIDAMKGEDVEHIKELISEDIYDPDEENIEEIKSTLKAYVDDFYNCLDSREVTYFIHKGEYIIATGGMSWGDCPTEAGEKFDRLYNIIDALEYYERKVD